MATVPTNRLEREMRKLYLRWLGGLSGQKDVASYIDRFQRDSTRLISRMGGQVASLGALADFPVPRTLELSPHVGTVYSEMKQAAISASITAGLNSKDAARQMLHAGLDKSYRRLERLARTETVSAYWKNSWDSVADLPLLVMVWESEQGHRTCDWCLSRDGLVVDDPNIRDHPNGRCTLVPTLRSRVAYKGTLQADGSITQDPAWTGKKLKTKASAGPTTAEQRDPLSGKSNPAAPSKAQPAQQVKPTAAIPTPKQAVSRYTTSEAFTVNNALRTGQSMPDIVPGLDQAIASSSLSAKTPVRRVVSGDVARAIKRAGSGKGSNRIVDKGYMSTQKASYGHIEDQIDDFAPTIKRSEIVVLEADLPRGFHALDIGLDEGGLGFDQGELLLPRNTAVLVGDLLRRVNGVAVYRVTFSPLK